MNDWLDAIKWDDNGLVPAIAQDYQTGRILMMAWICLLYTSPSPRDRQKSRMPSSA